VGNFEDDGKTFSPPDRRVGEDRRSLTGRGEGSEPADGDYQNDPAHRRSTDRRVLRYGLLYAMSRPVAEVEEWLDTHCDASWNVMLEDLDDNLERKTIRVLFELESDKQNFVHMVQTSG
jgi:hypothetical protein